MSLNHKRRIFSPGIGLWPPGRHALPALGLLLAACGGAVTLVGAASWLFRTSDAPAEVPASSHLSANGSRLFVLDGGTLQLGERVVQLQGIIAPARGSICHASGRADFDCGAAAANALAALVRGTGVVCDLSGHNAQGRPVWNCEAGGKPLSEALVASGWARAEHADLLEPEALARAAGRGLWQAGS